MRFYQVRKPFIKFMKVYSLEFLDFQKQHYGASARVTRFHPKPEPILHALRIESNLFRWGQVQSS